MYSEIFAVIILIIIILLLIWPTPKKSSSRRNSFYGYSKGTSSVYRNNQPPAKYNHNEPQPVLYNEKVRKTYEDERGYLRWKSNDRLVHRDIAYRYIYKPNRLMFNKNFSEYDVHHKNGNKKDNRAENLEILTREEHKKRHEQMAQLKRS